MNEYLKDASFFLRRAAGLIEEGMPREKTIEASLHFAFGMERLLKSILFDLNPIYVYKSQEFKNTAPLLYRDRLLPNASHNREIAKEPDADVLTFKLSLLRSKSISQIADRHTNLLFSLSNFRDIIAHLLPEHFAPCSPRGHSVSHRTGDRGAAPKVRTDPLARHRAQSDTLPSHTRLVAV
jgi:hypothetical protein